MSHAGRKPGLSVPTIVLLEVPCSAVLLSPARVLGWRGPEVGQVEARNDKVDRISTGAAVFSTQWSYKD